MSERVIPFVQQLTRTECGAACLSMTLGYFGRRTRIDEVRDVLPAGAEGVNALRLLEAARQFGLQGHGVTLEVDQLERLGPGAILHWEFAHFLVFERLRDRGVDVVDPAIGRRHLSMDVFAKGFTGVALLLEPGPGFIPAVRAQGPTWGYLRQLAGHRDLLLRLIVTSVLVQLLALAVPSLTGTLVDRVLPRADYHLLWVLAVGIGMVAGFILLSSMVRSHLLIHLRTHLDARMTVGFLDHLVDLPYPFFQVRSAGDLLSRLNSQSNIREILTSTTLTAVLDGTFVLLYLGLMLLASPALGALVLGLGGLQLVIFFAFRGRQRELTAKNLRVDAVCRGYQVEVLTGIETLKAMGLEREAVERFSGLYVDVLNVAAERGQLNAISDSLTAALRVASPAVILCVGSVLVMRGGLSLGEMLALSALAAGFLVPMSNLVSAASQLQLLGSYYERTQDILEAPREQDASKARPPPRLQGGISVEDASFSYTPAAPPVIRGLSLQIQPGQLVAIVGPSGAGKSTLAHLLVGLYLPSSGRILYDGHPLSSLDLRAVRQQLGIVTQSSALFAGSIRDNIAGAAPGAGLDEIVQACRMAQIHKDIMAMPMQYDTLLSDRGGSLSGGQRQRLALARALARKPALLLLDEATSALDAVTEAKVQEALSTLPATRIVIAHRLSTIKAADQILVLDQGALVEAGRHEVLLAQRGHYWSLVAAQRDTPAISTTSTASTE